MERTRGRQGAKPKHPSARRSEQLRARRFLIAILALSSLIAAAQEVVHRIAAYRAALKQATCSRAQATRLTSMFKDSGSQRATALKFSDGIMAELGIFTCRTNAISGEERVGLGRCTRSCLQRCLPIISAATLSLHDKRSLFVQWRKMGSYIRRKDGVMSAYPAPRSRGRRRIDARLKCGARNRWAGMNEHTTSGFRFSSPDILRVSPRSGRKYMHRTCSERDNQARSCCQTPPQAGCLYEFTHHLG